MSESCDVQPAMVCPNCGGCVPDDITICPDCHEDLSALAQVEYRHVILYNEALSLAREGQLPQAQERVAIALALCEPFPEAHELLAKLYARKGDWSAARLSARRALELSPEEARMTTLVDLIEHESSSAQTKALRQTEKDAAVRRMRLGRAFALYERDVTAAFLAGAGVAASVVAVFGWARGRRRRRA